MQHSTKVRQTVYSKLRQQSTVEKSGSSLPQKMGAKNVYICSVSTTVIRDLMANIFWTKRDV